MFALAFFILVELPSMIVMTIHKLMMTASGRQTQPLPIWAYRLVGFCGWTLLLPIAVAPLASDAGYLLWILVAAIVIFVVVLRRRASVSVDSLHANRHQTVAPSVAPHLGWVRDQARRALSQTFENAPPDPNAAAQASDLAAALQFYALSGQNRVSVAQIRDFFDRDSAAAIDVHIGVYARHPPSPDRDWAMHVLNHYRPLASSSSGGDVHALTRIALGRAARA